MELLISELRWLVYCSKIQTSLTRVSLLRNFHSSDDVNNWCCNTTHILLYSPVSDLIVLSQQSLSSSPAVKASGATQLLGYLHCSEGDGDCLNILFDTHFRSDRFSCASVSG